MGFLDSITDFFKDVMEVITTPFREISKMITGIASDQTQAGIDLIEHAGDQLGIDTLANNITNGISSIGGAGLNVLDKGSDSLFGAIDIMSYLPYVAIGFVGLFGLKFGSQMISEGGRSYRGRR